jgi:hypothetical protein
VERALNIEEPAHRRRVFASEDLQEIPFLLEEARLVHDVVVLAAPEQRAPRASAEDREAGSVRSADRNSHTCAGID